MTLHFRVQIDGEVHQVRVEVPAEAPESERQNLEEFVLTTAWLEHVGRLPRGLTNVMD